jgi:hypothetical protein
LRLRQEFVDKLAGILVKDANVMACGIKLGDAGKELRLRDRHAALALH